MGSRSNGGYESPDRRGKGLTKFPIPPRILVIRGRKMPPIKPTRQEKVQYVKKQKQTRKHHCHWPGCTKQVPPAMWGCYGHWMLLPKYLRDKIWEAYRIGQEVTMRPSREYLNVANEVQEWIKEHFDVAK